MLSLLDYGFSTGAMARTLNPLVGLEFGAQPPLSHNSMASPYYRLLECDSSVSSLAFLDAGRPLLAVGMTGAKLGVVDCMSSAPWRAPWGRGDGLCLDAQGAPARGHPGARRAPAGSGSRRPPLSATRSEGLATFSVADAIQGACGATVSPPPIVDMLAPPGSRTLSCLAGNSLLQLDLEKGTPVALPLHAPCRSIDYINDSTFVLAARQGSVLLFDSRAGKPIALNPESGKHVQLAVPGPSRRRSGRASSRASAAVSGPVSSLSRSSSGTQTAPTTVECVRANPASRLTVAVASSGSGPLVRIWDLRAPARALELSQKAVRGASLLQAPDLPGGAANGCLWLDYSPCGASLAVVTQGDVVCICDAHRNYELKTAGRVITRERVRCSWLDERYLISGAFAPTPREGWRGFSVFDTYATEQTVAETSVCPYSWAEFPHSPQQCVPIVSAWSSSLKLRPASSYGLGRLYAASSGNVLMLVSEQPEGALECALAKWRGMDKPHVPTPVPPAPPAQPPARLAASSGERRQEQVSSEPSDEPRQRTPVLILTPPDSPLVSPDRGPERGSFHDSSPGLAEEEGPPTPRTRYRGMLVGLSEDIVYIDPLRAFLERPAGDTPEFALARTPDGRLNKMLMAVNAALQDSVKWANYSQQLDDPSRSSGGRRRAGSQIFRNIAGSTPTIGILAHILKSCQEQSQDAREPHNFGDQGPFAPALGTSGAQTGGGAVWTQDLSSPFLGEVIGGGSSREPPALRKAGPRFRQISDANSGRRPLAFSVAGESQEGLDITALDVHYLSQKLSQHLNLSQEMAERLTRQVSRLSQDVSQGFSQGRSQGFSQSASLGNSQRRGKDSGSGSLDARDVVRTPGVSQDAFYREWGVRQPFGRSESPERQVALPHSNSPPDLERSESTTESL